MMGELINCMASTHEGRCRRCAVCRVLHVIENGLSELQNLTDIARHVDRLADEVGAISEYVERL